APGRQGRAGRLRGRQPPMLRAIAVLGAAAVLTLALLPAQLIGLAARPALARRIPLLYHRCLGRLLGIRQRIHGTPAAAEGVLFVANHISWLAMPVLGAQRPLAFAAKSEVAGWPIFGWLAKLQRSVFVARERRAEAAGQGRMLRARLLAGDNLVLFP